MKTNKLLPLVLFAYVSAALADKTWSGAVSSDWSDPANWAEGAVPGDDETVTLTANTPFAPTNLDIQGLHLDAIKFDAEQTQGFTISGEPFYLVSAHKGVDSARSADLLGSRRYRAASVRL